MVKILLILPLFVLFLLLIPLVSWAQVNCSVEGIGVDCSRTGSEDSATTPVTFTLTPGGGDVCSALENPNYWQLRIYYSSGDVEPTLDYGGPVHSYPFSETVSDSISLPVGNTYWQIQTFCSLDDSLGNPEMVNGLLNGVRSRDLGNAYFTISAGPAAGPSEGAVGGAAVPYHLPEIKLLTSLDGKSFSGTLAISYEASDLYDLMGMPESGLGSTPVSFYYGSPTTPGWVLIADKQAPTGTILWDTSKLPDGSNYTAKAVVTRLDNGYAQLFTQPFTLDNTSPNFTAKISPTFSRGEPIQIEIETSEILKARPSVSVTQFNHEPVEVKMSGDLLGAKFNGQYELIPGFDGPAKVDIEVEDLAGNKSTANLGTDRFAVGMQPPPAATIEMPKEKNATTTAAKAVIPLLSGSSFNAKKVVVKVNGTKEYTQDNLKDWRFKFENIELDPKFNKGKNVVSVVGYDQGGAASEPTALEIYINSPPEITLLEPQGRLLQLNGPIRFHWNAFDINDDVIKYTVELSKDRGESWKGLTQNLTKTEFVWDSTTVPDGSNYMVRIAAFDGSLTNFALSNRISVINDLPAIILETSGDVFTSEKSKSVKGMVRSKNDLLTKLELSTDNGKTWETLLPEDGAWDSAFERFGFTLRALKGGEQKIILRGISASKKSVINAQGLRNVFDDVAPTLAVETLASRPLTSRLLNLLGIAKDNLSGIKALEYKIDDSNWYEGILQGAVGARSIEFKIAYPEPLPDGKHEIKLMAVDRAENVSKIKSQIFTIDATPPRIGSFTLKVNGKMIFPNEDGIFEILPQSSINFLLAIAGQPKKAELWLAEKNLNLKLNPSTKLWETNFILDKEGLASLKIKSQDSPGNKVEREIAKLSVTQKLSPAKELPKKSFWERFIDFFRKAK